MIQYLERYALERTITPGSAAQLRYTLAAYSRWLCHPATSADFTDDLVNRWLASLTQAQATIRSKRLNLLTIWRAAVEDGVIEVPPRRIRKANARALPLPEAWHLQGLAQILAAAEGLTGTFRTTALRRSAFWRAFILTGYCTGLRLSDLLALRLDQIGSDGSLCVVQQKTGRAILCRLSPEAVAAVEATFPPARVRVFGDVLGKRHIQEQFRALVASAGLPGSAKWLRRSGATWIEATLPGSAMGFLGHVTPGLAFRHYVDCRHLQNSRPLPPSLTG